MIEYMNVLSEHEIILERHKALSNNHRIAMLSVIASANRNEQFINANILSEAIDLEQGLCSHHLTILKNAGLVRWESITMDGAKHKALYVNSDGVYHLIHSLQTLLER